MAKTSDVGRADSTTFGAAGSAAGGFAGGVAIFVAGAAIRGGVVRRVTGDSCRGVGGNAGVQGAASRLIAGAAATGAAGVLGGTTAMDSPFWSALASTSLAFASTASS